MHHDIEGAHGGGWLGHKAGEADTSARAMLSGESPQLLKAALATDGLINRAANDVTTQRQLGWQLPQSANEIVLTFPPCHGADQPNPHGGGRRRRQTGERVQIELRSAGGKFLQVDGVVQHAHRQVSWSENLCGFRRY